MWSEHEKLAVEGAGLLLALWFILAAYITEHQRRQEWARMNNRWASMKREAGKESAS